MNESDSSGVGVVDGSILDDQISECDEIIEGVLARHESDAASIDIGELREVKSLYDDASKFSKQAFESRYIASALYDVLKAFLRGIGEERGYDERLQYENRGRVETSDALDNCLRWFKLYAGVILDRNPEVTYEWAFTHFKEHRDTQVTHQGSVRASSNTPDPTFFSSIVPLWYGIEDILTMWREILDMDPETRQNREYVLQGEISPDGGFATYRYGFIRDLAPDRSGTHTGYITDYQIGEGGGCKFYVGDTNFFPKVGDVIRYNLEESDEEIERTSGLLTVSGTVEFVE